MRRVGWSVNVSDGGSGKKTRPHTGGTSSTNGFKGFLGRRQRMLRDFRGGRHFLDAHAAFCCIIHSMTMFLILVAVFFGMGIVAMRHSSPPQGPFSGLPLQSGPRVVLVASGPNRTEVIQVLREWHPKLSAAEIEHLADTPQITVRYLPKLDEAQASAKRLNLLGAHAAVADD